ncbi:MAG: tRNA (adenosine(37)-N6)-dimethylallyltransferase MiaA [Chlorobiaceae bacterium]|nr:tRNA (adenosine(37)-N6)-dimethylallyltransferase MiaA [Chlorobiaceae bacterium]MBA4309213.1 tRNA (adenosine(37)-N6)-dimethylallyltransferase MiaA [Chlorobiaceae bacterium]
MSNNLVVILGPTASGKTKFATYLASKLNGEIISADSRQVYRGMNIGTGKDLEDYIVNDEKIIYHLIDIVDPKEEFNLFQFQHCFFKSFQEISDKKKLTCLVGGSGLYLAAILQNYNLNKANFNDDDLVNLDTEELKRILFSLTSNLHNTTDLIDKERIIKAINVARSNLSLSQNIVKPEINPIVFGINIERALLKKKITERLKHRINNGMIEEVKELLTTGVSHDKLKFFGLEYKFISLFLQNQLNYNDMFQKLNSAIYAFAKRQMTWFRKMEKAGIKINWIEGNDFDKANNLIETSFHNDD